MRGASSPVGPSSVTASGLSGHLSCRFVVRAAARQRLRQHPCGWCCPTNFRAAVGQRFGQHRWFTVAAMDRTPDVFQALDRDWLQLIRHGGTRRRCALWEHTDPLLAGVRTPEALLHGCQNRSDPAAGNQVMGALLRRQDPTARRVVLQPSSPASSCAPALFGDAAAMARGRRCGNCLPTPSPTSWSTSPLSAVTTRGRPAPPSAT